ncbi:MFS transporter [Niveispirillum sp.]|uniref:MFS transporter n=1 Tax=Niveispirillum sp. TaxID=1917217 RepID=UPI001B7CA795|nr:glycoside-pentoside-hexuronide (GPH):cation symporter [Niveispirillum sp.]MBP7334457.1 MFS transporter [Niveispirillum sp.]
MLGFRARIGYAVGDFGLNLYWQSLLLFILFFQMDALGLSAVDAGLSYLVASIWDAGMDPLMGVISDRTRTRMGRYRPFILFGTVPLAVSFWLCFSPPGFLVPGSAGMLVFATLTHMGLRTCYAVVAIPYSSLTAAMTRDSDERASLTGWRMLLAFAGSTSVSALLPLLAGWFDSYSPAAACIGGLAVLAHLACVACVRELPPPATDHGASPMGLRADLGGFMRGVLRNGPLLRLLAATVALHLSLGILMRNVPYLLKYDLGGDATLTAQVLTWFSAVGVLAVPLWVWVARRWSKGVAWQGGSALVIIGCIALVFAPAGGLWDTLACLTLISFGHAAHAVAMWSMLPDAVDYAHWRHRRRDEAKVYGLASLILKLALGGSAFLGGLALDGVGYVPGVAQTEATLSGFRLLAGLASALGLGLSMLAVAGYKLTAQRHGRIQRFLGRRAVTRSGPGG